MSAYLRMSLLMLAVFAGVYGVGMVLFIEQGRHDVVREQQAARVIAEAIGHPDRLAAGAVAAVRHLVPERPSGSHVPASRVPGVFSRLLLEEQTLPTVEGWVIDPGDEVEEIWEGFVLISSAYGVGMLLCFAALFWAVRRGVKPLCSLGEAMEAVGAGRLASRLPRQTTAELDQLVTRFNAMATALESEQQTVARLLEELLCLQDQERARIARALHDDLGQYLTGIRAQARSWVYEPELSEAQREQARQLAAHCETVHAHFRGLLNDLHPLVMEQLGLASAIQHLVEQWQQLSGLPCDLVLDEDLPALVGEQQTHLYRFLQEALTNVARHARATRATLEVLRVTQGLKVAVADDGRGGLDLSERIGLGVRSMRERARCLGGEVAFLSAPGRGVRVSLTIPL